MKTKFGAIITDGRGKIGGHVASKNRAGSYLRTKVTPVNPQTSAQTVVRNRLAVLSSAWRSLTAAQREAWNAAVADFAKTDVFGDLRNPTGFNLYQRLNNNLSNIGESTISTPPAVVAVDAFSSLSLAAEDGTVAEAMTMTFSPAIESDMKVKVSATPPISAGISFVKSEYRQVAVLDSSDTSAYNLLSEYQAVFGSTGAAGQKIFVKCVQVETSSGIAGTSIEASAIVTASS